MLKFSIKKEGKNKVGIGLSFENIEHLRAGKPILIKLDEMHVSNVNEVFIFAGKTEEIMYASIKQWIGPETLIRKYDKRGNQDD